MSDKIKVNKATVEELDGIASDEQSAAWREVVRDALTLTGRMAWLGWSYLMFRLASEIFIAWMQYAQ